MALGETAMRIANVTESVIGVGYPWTDGADAVLLEALVGGGVRVAAMLLVLTGLVMLMREASAATRHAVWRVGFVAALLLPILAAATPWRLELLPGRVEVVEPTASKAVDERAAWATVPPPPAPARPASADAPLAREGAAGEGEPYAVERAHTEPLDVQAASASWSAPDLSTVLLLVWLAGALLLGVRLLIGHAAVRRIVRDGRRLTAAEWTSPLYEAADILDVEVDVDLIASERITMPFTAGIRRPVIVLPDSAQGWDTERRRAVLMHELAHVRRGDLFSHHVARWVCALHWFNPLAWAGARRMRADSERAADDLVLGAGTRASDYADHLLQIVSTAGRSLMPAPALPLAQRREFEGRMLAILEPGIRRRGPGRLQSLAVTALVLLMTLPLAAVGREDATLEGPAEHAHESMQGAAVANRNQPDPDVNEKRSGNDASDELSMSEPSIDSEPATGRHESPQDRGVLQTFIGDVIGAVVPIAGQAAQDAALAVVPALLEAVTDVDVEVRQTAVEALGEMADPRAVQALMRILGDDPVAEVRAAAAFALGEIEDAAAVPALAAALRDDASAEVRKNAAWALGQIEDARAVEALGGALRDADAEVRQTSMWALGQIESPAAVPALIAALSSDDVEVRRTAAWALGQIEDARAVEGLALALRSDDAELRAKAAWALGQIESRAAVGALARVVGDPVADVRSAAVHALAQIEDPASAAALAAALADESHEVRSMAAFALGDLSLSVAPPALIQALRDPHPEVRMAAAHALGDIGDAAAIDALTARLNDDDDDVRMAAIHALLDMDSDAGTGALLELLEHEDPQVRKRAAEALGNH